MAENGEIILVKVVGSLSWSPLHTASAYGHLESVNDLLGSHPMLAQVPDSADRTALHLASARGHVDVVKSLMGAAPETCLTRDRDGRNPVHVAAMNGKVDVLKELVQASPHAARARLDRDETILHLCVKLNQLESLRKLMEMIDDEEFVNAKDCEGNTILHLAVIGRQWEILRHVIKKKEIDVNARNKMGDTVKDMVRLWSRKVGQNADDDKILDLVNAKAKSGLYFVQGEWISRNREPLMVVVSLIATIAFQAGVSPPGGVWQDNSNGHSAGESVMAYHYPYSYKWFLGCSTFGFVTSIATLLLLNSGISVRNTIYRYVIVVVMMLTITFVVATYAISLFWVTPKKHRQTLTEITAPAIILFFIVIVILLVLHMWSILANLINAPERPMKEMVDDYAFQTPAPRRSPSLTIDKGRSTETHWGDYSVFACSAGSSPREEVPLSEHPNSVIGANNQTSIEVSEAEGVEIQRVEVLPSEHSNSGSVTGRQINV